MVNVLLLHKTIPCLYGVNDFRITVGHTTRIASTSVRNLGVVFDSSLRMTSHIRTFAEQHIYASSQH